MRVYDYFDIYFTALKSKGYWCLSTCYADLICVLHASKENVKIKLGFGIYSFSAILMRGMHAKKGDNLFALILKCHRIQVFFFVVWAIQRMY